MRTLIASFIIAVGMALPVASDAQDVSTVDGIIESLYASISGPAGERDWDFFRSLFVPTATMGAMSPDQEGKLVYHPMTPDSYIERNGPFFLENGFWEEELGRQEVKFGELMHVFSAYEFRMERGDEVVKRRGINSIQLVQQDDRWWIVSLQWNPEREGFDLPKKMAKG